MSHPPADGNGVAEAVASTILMWRLRALEDFRLRRYFVPGPPTQVRLPTCLPIPPVFPKSAILCQAFTSPRTGKVGILNSQLSINSLLQSSDSVGLIVVQNSQEILNFYPRYLFEIMISRNSHKYKKAESGSRTQKMDRRLDHRPILRPGNPRNGPIGLYDTRSRQKGCRDTSAALKPQLLEDRSKAEP